MDRTLDGFTGNEFIEDEFPQGNVPGELGPGRSDRHPDFQKLLGPRAWEKLPAAVRTRFAADAHDSADTVYEGSMRVSASFAGRVMAHVCRLIGTPVVPYVGQEIPVRVRVFNGKHGVVWERRYEFPGRPASVVRSTKQLDDDGMLVEALNAGLHMRLRVFEEDGALHFVSTGYFLLALQEGSFAARLIRALYPLNAFFRLGAVRVDLPRWFLPGITHVVHEDLGNGLFRFLMRTEHSHFGEMFLQDGVFR